MQNYYILDDGKTQLLKFKKLDEFKDKVELVYSLKTYNNGFKYDLKENTNNDYLLEHYPWIDAYLKNFTSGNQEPLYVVDSVVNPYYLTDFKKSKYLDNKFVARAHVYSGMGDSCGLIAISTVNGNLQLSYIIAPLYENIIF